MYKVFIGIDLAGNEKRPSGVAILYNGSKLELSILHSNDEIINLILRKTPIIVAIDAPLTLPKNFKMRHVDKLMRRIGYKVLPPCFPGMIQLTKRGIWLKDIIENHKIKVIEIHPYSIIRTLGFKKREEFLNFIKSLGIKVTGIINSHTIDAMTAAYTAYQYNLGNTFNVKAHDGCIVLPLSSMVYKNLNEICVHYSMRKSPLVAVDVVILFNGSIVLVKRLNEPYKNCWALPGGFVEYGETVEKAAIREAKEETGLDIKLLKLVGVYSDPKRDPRGHVISIAFLAKRIGGELKAASDAKEVRIFEKIPKNLAFDHEYIIRDALEVAKKLGYKKLPTF